MLRAYCFGNTFWTSGSLSFYCLDYLWYWIFKTQYLRYGGGIYEKEDDRRDAGFSIFVFGINLGAFVAPYLVGYLGQEVNFHLGFSLAAIGMFFGLVKYVLDGKKYLPESSLYPTDPLSQKDQQTLIKRLLITLVVVILVVIGLVFTHQFNVDMIVNIFTVIAVIIPIYYFFKILSSQKITATERSQEYLPTFLYLSLEYSSGLLRSRVLLFSLYLRMIKLDFTLMYLGIRFISI